MKRAFTLVECLIVIAIISLLAAVAIPNLMRVRAKVETRYEGRYKGYYSEGRHEPIETRCTRKGGCPDE